MVLVNDSCLLCCPLLWDRGYKCCFPSQFLVSSSNGYDLKQESSRVIISYHIIRAEQSRADQIRSSVKKLEYLKTNQQHHHHFFSSYHKTNNIFFLIHLQFADAETRPCLVLLSVPVRPVEQRHGHPLPQLPDTSL